MAPEPEKSGKARAGKAWTAVTSGLLRVSALTVLLLAAVAFGILTLLTREVLQLWPWEVTPTDKDARATYADLVKVALAVAGGTGAAVGLVVAYRRQKHAETDDAGKRSRYAGAAQQLGDLQAAVRMAGAYAMANLADEWPNQRQQCVDVLCAYLRLPWTTEDLKDPEPSTTTIERTYPIGDRGQQVETRVYAGRAGEREVRRTLTRIITDHLQADAPVSWSTLRLDLTGASLVDASFNRAVLQDATFRGAAFSGDAWFIGVTFPDNAVFTGVTFSEDAWFLGATFSTRAWFRDAKFQGNAWFKRATFAGDAAFHEATFSAYARFDDAIFYQEVGFTEAIFRDEAWFKGTIFSGDAAFDWSSFSKVWFIEAIFSGLANFERTTFSRIARFGGTSFANMTVRGAIFPQETTWAGTSIPNRRLFGTCDVPPIETRLAGAVFRDEGGPRPPTAAVQ